MQNKNLSFLKKDLSKYDVNNKYSNFVHRINLKDYKKQASLFYKNQSFCKHQLNICDDFFNVENEGFVLYEKFLLGD